MKGKVGQGANPSLGAGTAKLQAAQKGGEQALPQAQVRPGGPV